MRTGAAALLAMAILPLAAFAPRDATAGPRVNAKEAVQDRAQVRRDQRQLQDDRADFRRLADLIRHLDQARARGDRLAANRYRNQIHSFMNREVAETQREVAQDRREVRQSRRELASERDRRDRRDDRRDLRDDARDTGESRDRLTRERAILAELRSLMPALRRGDRRAEARERALYGEFLQLTRRDALQSGKELREDRGEQREDRRERREDRRDRREGY